MGGKKNQRSFSCKVIKSGLRKKKKDFYNCSNLGQRSSTAKRIINCIFGEGSFWCLIGVKCVFWRTWNSSFQKFYPLVQSCVFNVHDSFFSYFFVCLFVLIWLQQWSIHTSFFKNLLSRGDLFRKSKKSFSIIQVTVNVALLLKNCRSLQYNFEGDLLKRKKEIPSCR